MDTSFDTKQCDQGKYVTTVYDTSGQPMFTSEKSSSYDKTIKEAKEWVDWCIGVPLRKVESIYYIISVPDSWQGPLASLNRYSGLQVKIGITKDINRRISNLRTGSSNQLIVHAMEPGNLKREKELHEKFDSDRRQGEWFACSLDLGRHIFEIWHKYRILPPEHQYALLKLNERMKILRGLHTSGERFDMINPSLNEEWHGRVFLDLVYSSIRT